jgi:hypothetical protein
VRQEATSGSSRKCIALILTQDFGLFLHQERVTKVSVEPFPIAPQKVLPSFLEMGHCIICCWGVVVFEHNNIPEIPFSAIGAELMISSHITLFIVKHITSLAIICAFGFWTPQQNLWENHISFLIYTKKINWLCLKLGIKGLRGKLLLDGYKGQRIKGRSNEYYFLHTVYSHRIKP